MPRNRWKLKYQTSYEPLAFRHRETQAFYNCISLVNVDIGTLWADAPSAYTQWDLENSYKQSFYNCYHLRTVTGTIDFTNVPTENGKDMFTGCISLRSVTIKNGTGQYDITRQNVIVDGTTYDYAYEILGLTADQMANVVTLI